MMLGLELQLQSCVWCKLHMFAVNANHKEYFQFHKIHFLMDCFGCKSAYDRFALIIFFNMSAFTEYNKDLF